MPRAITFLVPGQDRAVDRGARRSAAVDAASVSSPAGVPAGRLKHSVRVAAARAAGDVVEVTAVPGRDIVVLQIAGGPALTLHPENARDLLEAQADAPRKRGGGALTASDSDRVSVPVQLRWRSLEEASPVRGATRGLLGNVMLTGIDVLTDLFTEGAADLTAREIVRRVDAQVEAGVYGLTPDALPPLKGSGRRLARVPEAPNGAPLLVLCHGTFSNTSGTFSRLWTDYPQRVRSLFTHYSDRVYGLDHPTLGASPIANALALVDALPADAVLHFLTHSRGGLVAEVMARICGDSDDPAAAFRAKAQTADRRDLALLARAVKKKRLRVERVVRVACPARGTLLASKRLDAYLSVFNWTLGLAGVPVLPALVDFLAALATRRTDPATMPGLAAQMPDSPLIQWLHAVKKAIPGDLRVIAGDVEGDSVTTWLKTLLADAFFWTDSDFVVQTRSMYGGAPRSSSAQFVLDQGSKVSHFGYFAHERTTEAITNALTQDQPTGFRTIGPLSWAGESSTGVRAALSRVASREAAEKPALFLLPGILGSHLRAGRDRIWLSWRIVNGLDRLDYTGAPDTVQPDGPIEATYDNLTRFLAASHDVIEFSFDWRKPLEEEARRLGVAVKAALDARKKTGQPVRMLAHSMGGLLARVLHLEAPDVWKRMTAVRGARILMLGTPNDGSWAPMQVLSGDDTFGNTLSAVGAPLRQAASRDLIAKFPGLLQLQAGLLDETQRLNDHATWKRLAADDLKRLQEQSWWHNVGVQLDAMRWGVPSQAVLNQSVALRRRLDQQAGSERPGFSETLLLVVGTAASTPDGFEVGADGFVYLESQNGGDGRVTLSSARLPGVRTWRVEADHGSLPSTRSAFDAYLELLQDGTTKRLESLETTRGAAASQPVAHIRRRPSRSRATSRPPERESELLAIGPPVRTTAEQGTALRITVTNGNLTFVRHPLLLGHYSSTRLTGTEHVMDTLTGGAMAVSLKAGLYPDAPGTHQVFINTGRSAGNPFQPPRPEAVVVVGLGQEGKLRGTDLVHSVRQATIAWAQRVSETHPQAPLFEIAATLIGSGGSGITVGQSAQLIAQGVREANRQLADEDHPERRWPLAGHLQLIELYHDRAVEAWRALQLQAAATPGHYAIGEVVQTGIGSLRNIGALPRPLDSGYRGADYDFIRAESKGEVGGSGVIAYTLDTRRARTEVRAQTTQVSLLRSLVEAASNEHHADPQVGRTLFQLLVPIEMEPFLAGTMEMQIELDKGTAGIPWELLDTNTSDRYEERPWAIRAKLLRKLRTSLFRGQVVDADVDARVLVIGEPACDPKRYPRLSAAREEARGVAERLLGPQGLSADRVTSLISPSDPSLVGANARTVINTLLQHDWRIIHIAGHGEPPELVSSTKDAEQKVWNPRGVVLSDGAFLGPSEIGSMRRVPELVFVNCCHLAARHATQLLEPCERPNWPQFASGVADALIEAGVRCVIAAGWAVEDEQAKEFAVQFYAALLNGSRFIDAVAEAREAARVLGGNTWAAYQCYGDPDWYFRREGADAQRPGRPIADEFAAVASPQNLKLALETLAVKSEFQGANPQSQHEKLRHLEARFAGRWGMAGDIAEAFGAAWAAAGDATTAMVWYRRAIAAGDGLASMRASEQLGNLQVRTAWEAVAALRKVGGRNAVVSTRALAQASTRARDEIQTALQIFDKLSALQPTSERESLSGSAYKRLAMVERIGGRTRQMEAAASAMLRHYRRAVDLARDSPFVFYPLLNSLVADLVVNGRTPRWKGLDAVSLERVRAALAAVVRENPDFWSVVGPTELDMYEAVGHRALRTKVSGILTALEDLHARVAAPLKWRSVYDQADLVLTPYADAAAEGERDAALTLLDRLAGMAGVKSEPGHGARAGTTR